MSLTTISNLAALVLTPIALIGIREIVGTQGDLLPLIPSDVIVKELGLMMVIPVLIGFGIRIEKPNWILGRQQFLRKLASVLMALLLLLVISTGPRAVARHFMEIFLVTFLFTAVLFGVGWLICSVFQLSTPDRWAVLFEFPCRNLAIAAVLGMTVLNRPELVRFSAALFIIQTTMLLTLFSASIYLKKSVSPPDL